MYHGNGISVGGSYHVYLPVNSGKRLAEHQHGKYGSTCGDISCACSYGVCGNHSRACVSLGRAEGNACFKASCGIKEPCALFSKICPLFTCALNSREKAVYIIIIAMGSYFIGIFFQLVLVIACHINGENSRSLAYANGIFSAEHEMDIACKGRYFLGSGNIFLFVEHRLIEMCAAPALGNVEIKQLGKLCRSLFGGGVSPCPERSEKSSVFIKCHDTVHHGGNAHCAVGLGANAVFLLYVRQERSIAGANAVMDIIKGICPVAVFKAVLPLVSARSYGLHLVVDKARLYSCGAKLDAQICFSVFYFFSNSHISFPFP